MLGKLSQEVFKFITNLDYTDRTCLNKEKQIQSGEARAEEKTPAFEHITKSQRRCLGMHSRKENQILS